MGTRAPLPLTRGTLGGARFDELDAIAGAAVTDDDAVDVDGPEPLSFVIVRLLSTEEDEEEGVGMREDVESGGGDEDEALSTSAP